tara:strand:- start:23478 stop:24290 length:813 start_codon:yes stop_codon:yes gene_type:complete
MILHVDSFKYYLKIEQSDSSLPYLLLFHGFMGSAINFSHLINPLSTFCNPITIDLLGHGRSDVCHDTKAYSAENQISHIHSILERLQIQNLHLYGYSMGGRLAFQLLHHFPGFFQSGIIESAHCGLKNEPDRLERKKSDELLAIEIVNNFEAFLEKWVRLPLFKSTPNRFKEIYKKGMLSQDHRSMAASLRGFGSGVMPYICDKINEFEIPVHLIAGEKDLKYHLQMEQLSLMNSKFTYSPVPNAGHRVHADQPELLIELIREFLYRQNL